jgi:hypothetical protein
MNPLLQAGIGILANNTGNYGQFGPALAKGVGYGLQNVGQYKQQQADNKDREVQRLLYGQQITAQLKKAQQETEEENAAKEEGRQWLASMNIDMNNPGGFMAVSSTPQPIKSSPLPAGQPLDLSGVVPDFGNNNPLSTMDLTTSPPPQAPQTPPVDSVLDELGYTEGMKKMFYAHAKSNPQKAMEKLDRETTDYIKAQRRGKSEARDVIAKDRVVAREMGLSLKDYYTMKNRDRPQAQIINYGTSFTPAVDVQGNPVLLQPSKTGGQPNVVQGFMPADDAASARQSQSAARTRFSSLDRLDSDIEAVKNLPGLEYAVGLYSAAPVIPGTKQADAVAAIENLASRAAVQALGDMREASKTGGAVGQVTEKEWPKLEAQLANLNRKQSLPKFLEELNKFQNMIRSSMRLIDEAQSKEPRLPSQQAAPKSSAKPAPTGTVRKYNPATGRIE